MSHMSVTVRLRPVRFGFLVHPADKESLLQIFRINTCLWGGKFNPIIPAIKQIPSWWERHQRSFETAPQVVNGYLDFFEPDFLVEARPGIGSALGFDPERVLTLNDILVRDGDHDERGRGLDVLDLYRYLYRKEYQFARRHEHDIVRVSSKHKSFRHFAACLFGDFPLDAELSYFGNAFNEAFDPKTIELDAAGLVDLFREGGRSALSVGHSELEVEHRDRGDPALFILDATKPCDLIDFWNLRATRGNVLPIPIQWAEEMSPLAKEFITKKYRPLPGNPNGVMILPTVMFARSIATTDIDGIHNKHFKVDVAGANCRQDWYPPLWSPAPDFTSRRLRPTLSSKSKSLDVQMDPERLDLRFESLHPEFASEYGNTDRWANVVKLRDWGLNDQVATVYPTRYRKSLSFRRIFMGDDIRSTTEGFVVLRQYPNQSNFWHLTDGTTALQEWLQAQKINTIPSDAGRATQQIVQTLGGFHGVSSLAHPSVVCLLNEISRKPGSRSIHYHAFRNRIENATKGDLWRGRTFEALVQNNAVELGLEIKCEKCSSWSWHPLKGLGYSIECGLCLKASSFPITDPGSSQNTRWSYRLVGPFALPDFARGGYAAALTLRFFADVIGFSDSTKITWSSGQELDLGPGDKVETDFILWYQRRQWFENDYPTDTVFGESKSFGKEAFEQSDIDKMKALAKRFPGSVFVFSTLKEPSKISTNERERLKKFAAWGREYIPGRHRTRAPVIILTGMELFAAHSLRSAWENNGGKHAEIAGRGWLRTENLRLLANLTQQLYLGMEPYGEFLKTKWKKRREKAKPNAAAE